MGEANADNLMRNLMRAQHRGHQAIIRAGCSRAPDQENMQLRILGSNLAVMGTINTAITIQAFINRMPARNLASPLPTYMSVILSVVHGFTFFSGITAMAIGWLLFVKDNPRQHRRLAENILLLIQFASAFTLGILLVSMHAHLLRV